MEKGNVHDDFAVAGNAKLPGKLIAEVVGHVPLELSRYFWFAIESGARFTARVISEKYQPSPLLQGGLEIPISVLVEWADVRCLQIFKENIDHVGYDMNTPYKDDSIEILKEIMPEELLTVEDYDDDNRENDSDEYDNDDVVDGSDKDEAVSAEDLTDFNIAAEGVSEVDNVTEISPVISETLDKERLRQQITISSSEEDDE